MGFVKKYQEFVVNEESEGQMYLTKLKSIIKNAQELLNCIGEDEDLEAWVQDKITIADHNMDAILGYYNSDKKGKQMPGIDMAPNVKGSDKILFDKSK